MIKGIMEGVAIIAIAVTLSSVGLALIYAPQFISDHQRYTTYLEAQRTVLECRANVASGRDVEDICGPIPTLRDLN